MHTPQQPISASGWVRNQNRTMLPSPTNVILKAISVDGSAISFLAMGFSSVKPS